MAPRPRRLPLAGPLVVLLGGLQREGAGIGAPRYGPKLEVPAIASL